VKFNYDFEDTLSEDERLTYLDDVDESRYSRIEFKAKTDPANGHAVPFVTGQRYHIHWGSGIDFTEFRVERSEKYLEDDLPITFVTNHTDIREAFNTTWKGGLIDKVDTQDDFKGLIDDVIDGYQGTNFKNEVDNEFEFMVNGRDPEDEDRSTLRIYGLKCIEGECPIEPPLDDDGIEANYRLWSLDSSWGEDG
jgi:hypothetical protein